MNRPEESVNSSALEANIDNVKAAIRRCTDGYPRKVNSLAHATARTW
jgi:hypothetical protein